MKQSVISAENCYYDTDGNGIFQGRRERCVFLLQKLMHIVLAICLSLTVLGK